MSQLQTNNDRGYALLSHAFWINNPFATRIAHRKLLQLKIASDVGLRTPRTLATNRPESAFAFADEVGGDLAIKSLGAISVTQEQVGRHGFPVWLVYPQDQLIGADPIQGQDRIYADPVSAIRPQGVGDQNYLRWRAGICVQNLDANGRHNQ